MRITWSPHALQRCLERDISKEDAENIILNPIQIVKQQDNKIKCYGIVSSLKDKQVKYLVAVYIEYMTLDSIRVITVMMKDKGGLKKDGFSL